MNITKGFVPVRPDGTFVYLLVTQSHTGFRTELQDVKTIEDATVCRNPTFSCHMAGVRGRDLDSQVNFVPVEVRREVVLLGYGKEPT